MRRAASPRRRRSGGGGRPASRYPERVPEPSAVDQVANGFWERFKALNPISATINGDTAYDDILPDPSPAGRAKERRLAEDMVAAAAAIPDEGLNVEDRITRDVLRVIGEIAIIQDDQRLDTLQVVDQMSGPQTLLPQLTQFQPADTPERLETFLARLHAYPAYMAANRELLREAMVSGLTAPRIVALRTIAQLERMLAIPIDQAVVPSLVRVASEEDREAIRAVVRDEIYPADWAFLEGLRGEYLAASREENGLWSAPNGDVLYRTQILRWTTLQPDPGEVHQIGLDELATIEDERREISRAAGFGDDTVAYRASLAADPANLPASREALIERALEDIERANAAAPTMFRRTPRSLCRVVAVEEYKERDAPFAYYYPPSADTTRPGTYYVNTFDLPSRSFSRLASATFHEAVPGHHFQIALESENTAQQRLPPVRGALRRRRVHRGLGPVRGAPRRRDGPVPQRGRAIRHARCAGVARGAARRRHRPARAPLDPPAVDRRAARGRTDRDRCGDRDGPLHLQPWPGAHVQARPARASSGSAPRSRRGTAPRSTCASSTTSSSATARCRSRPSRASCPTGWPRPPDPPIGRWSLAPDLRSISRFRHALAARA